MSRGLRVQFAGAIYHVTSRGNRRAPIVHDDDDRQHFWERIGLTVGRYGWDMFAATLMTNHFHLFFRTPQPNLSRGMQYLLSGYAHWWNRRHRTSGHVFQGRFRGHVVEDETYFWTVSRYVHLNPVPVLVTRPGDWPWSTYAGYMDPARRLPWVDYETLLDAWRGEFGGADAQQRYKNVVEGTDEGPSDPFAAAIDGWILGSPAFAERIREQLEPADRRRSAGQTRITSAALTETVLRYFGTSEEQLTARRSRHPARTVLAHLVRRHTGATLRELAGLLGLTRADCVPRLLSRAARSEPEPSIARALADIERELGLSSR